MKSERPNIDEDTGDDNPTLGCRNRTNSMSMKHYNLWIYVVNQSGEETLLEETDFDCVTPLGGGQQGKIYAAKVIFENEADELEVRYCVLKSIFQRRNTMIPFSAHEKISENDQTSVENKIIKLIKVVQDNDGVSYALLPYCDMFLDTVIMALKNMLHETPAQFHQIKSYLALQVLSDLCDAYISMNFDKGYVHGDVKPANVGFYRGHWCLIDMDCAKKLGEKVTQYSGSPAFSHPSVIRNRENVSLPWSDWFALGEMVNLIFSPQTYGCFSDRELIEKKDVLYREALNQKYGAAGAARTTISFVDRIQQTTTLEDSLKVIANYLTQPLATDQVDMLVLKTCLQQLKQTVQSDQEIKQLVESFYDSLKSDGYFNDRSTSAEAHASGLSASVDTSIFTSHAAFFASQGRADSARRSSTGSVSTVGMSLSGRLGSVDSFSLSTH